MTLDVLENHIAILVCDTPIENVTEYFGDFGDNINTLLLKKSLCILPFVKYQIKDDDEKRLNGVISQFRAGIESGIIKGVIFTGSRSDSFAIGVKWIDKLDELIKGVLFQKDNLPIVGICFGHQILARNLGSKVGRNLPGVGWEIGTTTIDLNPDIFSLSPNCFEPLKSQNSNNCGLNIVEFHQDIVHTLPTPGTATRNTCFLSIGSTPKCNIQGLISNKGPLKILTFQGHPEFTSEISLELIKEDYKKGIIDTSILDKGAYNTSTLNNQGDDIAEVICKFLFT